MSRINWNAPTKVTKKETFCGGPPGGYQPQMSDVDAQYWRGKHINAGKQNARIELRKTFNQCGSYSQVVIILAEGDGMPQKQGRTLSDRYKQPHVRISMNGTTDMTWNELRELEGVIVEAELKLLSEGGDPN